MAYEHDGTQDEVIGKGPDTDLEYGSDPEMEFALEVKGAGEEFHDAEKAVAKSIVELVRSGASLSDAAAECRTPVDVIKAMPAARAALRKLRDEYELNAEELKQLAKCKAVEIALTGEAKQQMDAVKFIGQMPDVGLTPSYAKVNVAVGVFSDETNKVLSSIDTE